MRMSFITSAVFNQNPSKAKREADERPLVITDHGKASYVLMRYSDFQAHWRDASVRVSRREQGPVSTCRIAPAWQAPISCRCGCPARASRVTG